MYILGISVISLLLLDAAIAALLKDLPLVLEIVTTASFPLFLITVLFLIRAKRNEPTDPKVEAFMRERTKHIENL